MQTNNYSSVIIDIGSGLMKIGFGEKMVQEIYLTG